MSGFELYVLKSTMMLSMMYFSYWLILRNKPNFNWNRYYLLFSLLLSYVVPAFHFSESQLSSETLTMVLEPIKINGFFTLNSSDTSASFLKQLLSIIYTSGAMLLFMRFLLSLSKLIRQYFHYPKYRKGGFIAVLLDNNQSPYTFFNLLFISKQDFTENAESEFLEHENVHRTECHTIDIVLIEIMTILQWYNPFVWLFRNSLRAEHEFLADKKVLQKGFDKFGYQKMLFEKSLGVTSFSLTSNFNYSLLKKRLKMMTINKSSSYLRLRSLVSIPVLALGVMISLVFFGSCEKSRKAPAEIEEMAKFRGGEISGVRKYIQKNMTYPESAKAENLSAKIYLQFDVNENGQAENVRIVRSDVKNASDKEVVIVGKEMDSPPVKSVVALDDIEAEAIRVVKSLDGFTPAKSGGKNVSSTFTVPMNFVMK